MNSGRRLRISVGVYAYIVDYIVVVVVDYIGTVQGVVRGREETGTVE